MGSEDLGFRVGSQDPHSRARSGVFKTSRSSIATPVFMPVATQATIKAQSMLDLAHNSSWEVVLANTYHLMLRPGLEVLQAAGGLHRFMRWKKSLLTDSGGYQVYSLAKNRTITDDDVLFRSHIDGSLHRLTPEHSVEFQRLVGADMVMSFDECTTYPATFSEAKRSMERTHKWLERSVLAFEKGTSPADAEQFFMPIVQGGMHLSLREQSAAFITQTCPNAEGTAIGGLSVGETNQERLNILDFTVPLLPESKARYLMGVGTPKNILDAVEKGIDMFDCVVPTRHARHGLLYTTKGLLNIRNGKWKSDFSPIDPGLDNPVSRSTSKAYLRHLFQAKETTAAILATTQNLAFYESFMADLRQALNEGSFRERRGYWEPRLQTKL